MCKCYICILNAEKETMNLINKSVLIVIAAQEFNEDEFLVTKSILEREGFRIFIASDAHSLCVGSRGMKVRPDVSFFNMRESNFSAVVLIGGKGIKNYWNNDLLHSLVNKFDNSNKLIAAICSAPVILSRAGLLNGKEATCYKSDQKDFERDNVEFIDKPVVFKKNIITAQDASAAQEFASTIVERLS